MEFAFLWELSPGTLTKSFPTPDSPLSRVHLHPPGFQLSEITWKWTKQKFLLFCDKQVIHSTNVCHTPPSREFRTLRYWAFQCVLKELVNKCCPLGEHCICFPKTNDLLYRLLEFVLIINHPCLLVKSGYKELVFSWQLTDIPQDQGFQDLREY